MGLERKYLVVEVGALNTNGGLGERAVRNWSE